jgi:hypothetical protein
MVVLSQRNDVSPSPVRRANVNPVFTSKRKKKGEGEGDKGTTLCTILTVHHYFHFREERGDRV